MLQSLEAYRTIVERASEGIAVIQDEALQYVNTRLSEILGKPEDELVASPFLVYIAPEESEKVQAFYRKRLRGEEVPATYETELIHVSGRRIPVEVNACVIQYRGRPADMVLVRDVTDRRQAVRALQESEERFRQLADLLPQTVYELDLEGNFVYANRHGHEAFGLDPDAEVGEVNVADVFDPSDIERVKRNMDRVLKGERFEDHEYFGRRPDGTRFPVHIYSTPIIRDSKAVGVRCVVVDVTEIKRAQEELRETEAHYRQAQKMEAIGQLAGGIAHDFNNVIATIRMQAYLAQKHLADDHPAREMLHLIEESTARAAALTGKLLAFGRKRGLTPRPSNLNMLVSGMCEMLRSVIGEKIDLVTKLDPQLGLAKVDPGQMEQVILNLVLNSRDAMPAGGRLTVETKNVEFGEDVSVLRNFVRPGQYVRLCVSDNGTGMTDDVKTHAFEPYFTTKGVGKGSGLGLPIVYGILKQSDGYVWIYSEPGHGTTVKTHFPRVAGTVKPPTPAPRRAGVPGKGETVLVVEDEEHLRHAAMDALEAAGYTVLEAFDGVDALRVLTHHSELVHLLLTDVVMPRMNGGELGRRATELHPKLKILFMSGYTADTFGEEESPWTSSSFIEKPFEPEDLLAKVRAALDRGTQE
jgi:PAS domain S-box-containing protein